MRYFICALENHTIQLAIPAEHTERIIPVTRTQNAEYETENKEVFVSLPALLKQKNISAPHGIVIKAAHISKTILLTPKIDIDLEIPEENIRQLPNTFIGLSQYFRGACFDKENLILILNTEKIMEGIR